MKHTCMVSHQVVKKPIFIDFKLQHQLDDNLKEQSFQLRLSRFEVTRLTGKSMK